MRFLSAAHTPGMPKIANRLHKAWHMLQCYPESPEMNYPTSAPPTPGITEIRQRLASYPASAVDEGLRYLFEALTTIVDAQDANWVGTVRIEPQEVSDDDPLLGWRVGAAVLMSQDQDYIADAAEKKDVHDSDPPMPSIVIAREAGTLRARRLMGGMVDMDLYRKTSSYYPLEDFGIIDRMFVSVPVHGDLESLFVLDRKGDRPLFSEADGKLIMEIVGSIPWFIKELCLAHGLHNCAQPLNQTEKRIVRLLLTDKTEPEIAATLGQATSTTHKYVTGIYRKYGVRGRAGLMSLWLSR